MAVPKRKVSKSRRGMRRSHLALSPKSLSACPNCGNVKLPHRVCPHCGYYKDTQVVAVKQE